MPKKIYIRFVKGGGMTLAQLILWKIVFQYSKNTSWSNGDVGTSFKIRNRNNTNL